VSRLADLTRAELLKLRTTRSTPGLAVGMALAVMVLAAITIAASSRDALDGPDGVRRVLPIAAGIGSIFSLCLGVLGSAGEYRHGTITWPLLAAPRRWPVLLAKVAAHGLAGLAFGAVAVVAVLLVAGPWMAARHAGFSFGDDDVLEVLGGSILACGLTAVIGVALGLLVRHQAIALLIGVGWMLLVDQVVPSAVPEVGRFLPGGAESALTRERVDGMLPMALGGLVLLGWAALLSAVATVSLRRRDVT
jgi:ABC-type transport system involved in multi-copper enzyme maturation permease subunit